MAVELHIFMSAARVPTADAMQEAIDRAGFSVVLDTAVDLLTHTGFWPATYKGSRTGFEFYLEPARDCLDAYPHIAARVGGRERCATFRWGGNFLEMCAALSAAAALTKLTDGVYFYPADDIIYGADEVIQATRRDLN